MINHIFNQINSDENIEVKQTLIEHVKTLYNKYINTLNNEEKEYLNVEDERTRMKKKYLYSSEIGVNINSNKLLRIGACSREVYFKMTGAYGKEREFSEIDTTERNELVKEQWKNKLKLSAIFKEKENIVSGELNGINIRLNFDGYIIDPLNENKEYILLIKPINDTAFSVRDEIWPKYGNPKPNNFHLAEVSSLLAILKKPVMLLYVGKNNTAMTQEFLFGLKNGLIKYKIGEDEITTNLSVVESLTSINIFKTAFLEENLIPPRSYQKSKELSSDEISLLIENRIINSKKGNELSRSNAEYVNFKCESCKYSKICNEINEEWVNRDE